MTLSVIVPTRNRADLWSRHWLLESLRTQTSLPDELIIATDHTEDDTVPTILRSTRKLAPRFPVRIIDVPAARPGPFPASGVPDNCLFHAASGDVMLHVDDDIALPPGYIAQMRALFAGAPSAVIWGLIQFVDADRLPIDEGAGIDPRHWLALKQRWTLLPGAIRQMPRTQQTHWGAVFAVTARDIRAIGGHDLAGCGFHNQDTRLGNRLARYCAGSYVTATDELTALHFGRTWHMTNVKEPAKIRAAYATAAGPKIANGGNAFWTSPWFDSAYTTTHNLA